METAKELLDYLNQSDECNFIEAKKASKIDRSLLERICAFANEPGIEGGHLLLGVAKGENSLFPSYEVIGIDNATHRQMNGLEILKASSELRNLRDKELVLQKGKGRSTYYIPNTQKSEWGIKMLSAPVPELSEPVPGLSEPAEKAPDLQDTKTGEPLENLSEPVDPALVHQLPDDIQRIVNDLPQRSNDPALVEAAILVICEYLPYKSVELSAILGRSEKYLLRIFLTRHREEGKLEYTHPEMPNHPQQAYKTVKNDD